MAQSMVDDMTAPYSAMESYLYDSLIAGAVLGQVVALLDEFLGELPQGARVLDVGCGGGQLVGHLAKIRPDLVITGVDLSHEQIGRARRRNTDFGQRVTFQQGSALEIPFPDGTFDVVVSIASIKHWPDQKLGVSECIRVLEPGGKFIIAEADRGCHLDAARAFVAQWRIPTAMRPLALMLFRTYVAGQGLSTDEARLLIEKIPVSNASVEVRKKVPVLIIQGNKKGGGKKAQGAKNKPVSKAAPKKAVKKKTRKS